MTLFNVIWVLFGILAFVFHAGSEVSQLINEIRKGQGGWNWLCLYAAFLLGHMICGPISFLMFRE